ncbi:MAG TPA: radical SAM protein [Polyangia bacterium]
MRVFLGNAPWREGGWRGVRAGSRWPHLEPPGSPYLPFPFFLAYAASLLRRDGHSVKLVDGIAEDLSEAQFVARARAARPELIVLETSLPSQRVDERVAGALRRAVPAARIAFAGALGGAAGEDPLAGRPFLDFVLVGEYEATLSALCARLAAGEDPLVDGVILRDSAGQTQRAPRRPPTADLGALPWPERDGLPMHRYADAVGYLPQPLLQVWASRGCPFGCDFCVWPQAIYGERRYRARPPEDVVAEIAEAVGRYRLRAVYFDDDTFNIGEERLLALADLLTRRGPGVPFGVMARADTCSRDAFRALHGAGLRYVKLGVESGDQALIDAMGKQLSLERVRATVGWLRDLGIVTHLTFTIGHPGETRLSAERTIALALELDPDSVQISLMTPFPGTALHARAHAEGLLAAADPGAYRGYEHTALRSAALDGPALEALLHEAQHRWYAHVLRRALGDPRRDVARAIGYALANPRHALALLRAATRA